MLNVEQPISSRNEDFLDRKYFADNIADAIKNYEDTNNSSLTIGLYGNWGSGKTSIINMIVEKLADESDIILFNFEPWVFSDTQQLISSFFKEFAKNIKFNDSSEKAAQIGEELETYAAFFKPISLIPEPTASVLSLLSEKVFSGIGKAVKKWANLKAKNLEDTKRLIEEHLAELDKKILIIIDDIDRLNNIEIRQIFQMIKVLGNFPNTIYLSSMDKEVVIEALSEVQKGDGSEYLEKIINVPFTVPMPSNEKSQQYLFSELDKVIGEESDFDQEYFSYIFRQGYSEFFENIRDINRYINILKFNYSIVGKEVDIVDLFVMTAFQVFEPKVYDYLKYNKDIVLAIQYFSDDAKKVEAIESFKNTTISLLSKLSKDDYLKLIETIFPALDRYSYDDKEKCAKLGRACSPDFYELYFKMSLDEGAIGKYEMTQYISNVSNGDIFKSDVDKLIVNNKIGKFLDRLLVYVKHEKFDTQQVENICNIFISTGDTVPDDETVSLFYYPSGEKMRSVILEIIKGIEEDKRFESLNDAIGINENSIELPSGILYSLMEEHGEYEKSPLPVENRLLTENHLNSLKDRFLLNIKTRIDEDTFHKSRKFVTILSMLKKLSLIDFEKYVDGLVNSDVKLIAFLKGYVGTSYSSNSPTPSLTYSGYHYIQDLVDPEKMSDNVQKIQDNQELQLDEREKFAINNFLKKYNDNNPDEDGD